MFLKLVGSFSWRANISTFPVPGCVTVLWQSLGVSATDEDLNLPHVLLRKDKRPASSANNCKCKLTLQCYTL